ncbi:hypothetical protein D7Y27_13470 [Corallococcus sp. AB004]|nr:hypothetical protein D7Y27_13470 [Corallococcus sp. AB004]
MTTDKKALAPNAGEFLVYVGDDGTSRVHVRLEEGSLWLPQKQLAELYGKDVRTINELLQNIHEEGELDPGATIRKFRIVQTAGTHEFARLVEHYCLPTLLAVGYRVRSTRGCAKRTKRVTKAKAPWSCAAVRVPLPASVRRLAQMRTSRSRIQRPLPQHRAFSHS